MPYVRFTTSQPRPDVRDEVLRHYTDLVRYVKTLPGCLDAYVLESNDELGEIGRMSFWESAEAANVAANDQHSMSLHAALHFDTGGELFDRSYDASS